MPPKTSRLSEARGRITRKMEKSSIAGRPVVSQPASCPNEKVKQMIDRTQKPVNGRQTSTATAKSTEQTFSVAGIVRLLIDAGLTIKPDGEKLIVKPAGNITPPQRDEIRSRKPELLAYLQSSQYLADRLNYAINEVIGLTDELADLIALAGNHQADLQFARADIERGLYHLFDVADSDDPLYRSGK
jgi:hypothetical protein